MSKYNFGSFQASSSGSQESIILESQNTDQASYPNGTPLYFSSTSNQWIKATITTPPPTGVYSSQVSSNVANIALGGLVTIPNLGDPSVTRNRVIYMADNGGLTVYKTDIIIGFSISETELVVKIQNTAVNN